MRRYGREEMRQNIIHSLAWLNRPTAETRGRISERLSDPMSLTTKMPNLTAMWAQAPSSLREIIFTSISRTSCKTAAGTTLPSRARVADVVAAANDSSTVVAWTKYYNGDWTEPGLGGRSNYLEEGNGGANWTSAS